MFGGVPFVPSGAYFSLIPPNVKLPAIRFHVQTPIDIRGATNASRRIMTQLDWLIVVVTQGHGIAPILPLADALDARLDDASGETSTILVQACVRLEPFNLLEADESGVEYRHAGGLYRTIVQPKS